MPKTTIDNQVRCTGDPKIIKEGRKSFPSGHTSSTKNSNGLNIACFAGLGYSSLYLGGQIKVFDKNGYVMKVILFVLPWIVATLIAITRLIDYRHHASDGMSFLYLICSCWRGANRFLLCILGI